MTNEEREALIAQGWTPPVAVDPDEGEVNGLLHEWLHDENVTANMMLQKALKRGRELERAVMGNPIPEQIQEVTPPVPVDPDIAEAEGLFHYWTEDTPINDLDIALAGIKRGRALAAEAKPGMVWVKHDGSEECPCLNEIALIKREGAYPEVMMPSFDYIDWRTVTHYAIITPPAEDVT